MLIVFQRAHNAHVLRCTDIFSIVLLQILLSVVAQHDKEQASSGNSSQEESASCLNEIYTNSKQTKRSSLYIDEELQSLRQDDPKLIHIIKNRYLHMPSSMPYNLSSENANIDTDGQYGQAKLVENEFFKVKF